MNKIIVFLMLFVAFSCGTTQAQEKIDAAKVEALAQDKSVQLVDLRTDGELKQTGKIEGARQINFNAEDFKTQIATLDKEKPVLLYCAAGGRSAQAAAQMKGMGFKTIYDYSGGMKDWKAKGKKTVSN